MTRISLVVLLSAISLPSIAEPLTLPQGSLACATEAAFDRQFKYLSQGVQRWVSGCGSTKVDQKVVVVDYNVFEATKVVVVANDTTLFILGRDLKRDERPPVDFNTYTKSGAEGRILGGDLTIEKPQPIELEPKRETPKQVLKYERPSS